MDYVVDLESLTTVAEYSLVSDFDFVTRRISFCLILLFFADHDFTDITAYGPTAEYYTELRASVNMWLQNLYTDPQYFEIWGEDFVPITVSYTTSSGLSMRDVMRAICYLPVDLDLLYMRSFFSYINTGDVGPDITDLNGLLSRVLKPLIHVYSSVSNDLLDAMILPMYDDICVLVEREVKYIQFSFSFISELNIHFNLSGIKASKTWSSIQPYLKLFNMYVGPDAFMVVCKRINLMLFCGYYMTHTRPTTMPPDSDILEYIRLFMICFSDANDQIRNWLCDFPFLNESVWPYKDRVETSVCSFFTIGNTAPAIFFDGLGSLSFYQGIASQNVNLSTPDAVSLALYQRISIIGTNFIQASFGKESTNRGLLFYNYLINRNCLRCPFNSELFYVPSELNVASSFGFDP